MNKINFWLKGLILKWLDPFEVEVPIVSRFDAPKYQHEEDAGADVRAVIKGDKTSTSIPTGGTIVISTGIKMAIPKGFEIQVRPRSGLAAKLSVTVLNSPGTIDGGYRDDIGVILHNHGKVPFKVHNGDRIGQFVLARYYKAKYKKESTLSKTDRNGGFGHTGKK
jgi:dUTP pyrophosphatase